MDKSKKKPDSVDDYIASYPKEISSVLKKIRKIIREAAPDAEELISYGMPAFKQNGMLVWYAAQKEHLGFYPTSTPIPVFKEKLKKYKTSKGAIQIPYNKPLPSTLIKAIVKFKLKENSEKAKTAKKKS